MPVDTICHCEPLEAKPTRRGNLHDGVKPMIEIPTVAEFTPYQATGQALSIANVLPQNDRG